MKAAWRLRRIALQNDLRTSVYLPIRFASSATAAAPAPPQNTYQPPRDNPFPTPRANEAGPSNYASRQTPLTPSHLPNTSDNFFTAHRPLTTPLQVNLASYSKSDADTLRDLQVFVNQPRTKREAKTYANNIWRRYTRLSNYARSQFTYSTLRNALRAVVPSKEHLQIGSLPFLVDRGAQPGMRSPGVPHGERLLRVLRDMKDVPVSEEGDETAPRSSDYRFALRVAGAIGDIHTAETIADEMRMRGEVPMDIRMIDSRLAALCEWLRLTKPKTLHGRRAGDINTILWQILGDISTFDLTTRNVTMLLLLQSIYTARTHIASPDIIANLNVVMEDVCAKAYGVNVQSLLMREEKEERLRGAHVYALVDYWGVQGEVWKMLSIYEVLAEQEAAAATGSSSEGREMEEDGDDDEAPTLSGMMQQEAEARKGMNWYGRSRNTESPVTQQTLSSSLDRDAPPHMPQTSSHPSPSNPTFSHFYPQPNPSFDNLTKSYPPELVYTKTRLQTETISVLIRHVITSGDMQLVNHVLASALASITPIRTEWLQALQLRQERTGGDISHPDWFSAPGPRVSVNHQWFWDADAFCRRSDALLPARLKFQMLVKEAKAQMESELETLSELPEAYDSAGLSPSSAHLTTFRPEKHTIMVESAIRKLDLVLERTQEGIDKKIQDWPVAEMKWKRRRERKEAAERERQEAWAARKQGRGTMREAAQPSGNSSGTGERSEIANMGRAWSGEDSGGVRMIGMA